MPCLPLVPLFTHLLLVISSAEVPVRRDEISYSFGTRLCFLFSFPLQGHVAKKVSAASLCHNRARQTPPAKATKWEMRWSWEPVLVSCVIHPTTHKKPGMKTSVTTIAQSYLRKGTQFLDCLFHSTQWLCNIILLCRDLILQSFFFLAKEIHGSNCHISVFFRALPCK